MAALPKDLVAVPVPQPAPRRRPASVTSIAPRRRSARYLALMVAVSALGVFGCVTLNGLAAEQSFAVRELETDVTVLTRTVDELTVEVTRLESPDRLHRVATTRLGMVPAEQPAFLVMERAASTGSGQRSRTIAAPAPAAD